MKKLVACLLVLGCSSAALPAEKCTPAFQTAHAANCAALLDGQLSPDDVKQLCADTLAELCPSRE